jgi:hypothetical protein
VLTTEILNEEKLPEKHERQIAEWVHNHGFDIWASPAGSATTWPDIGASIEKDGKTYNVHIEAKTSKTDQFGSANRWQFANKKFSLKDGAGSSDNGELLINVINNEKRCVARAEAIRVEVEEFFNEKFTEYEGKPSKFKCPVLYTGMVRKHMSEIGMDTGARAEIMQEYKNHHSYQITSPKIVGPEYGKMILDHYRRKFKQRPGCNQILFVLGNELFGVEHTKMMTDKELSVLCDLLDVDEIPFLPASFAGSIECRLGPRSSGGFDSRMILRADGIYKGEHGTRISTGW